MDVELFLEGQGRWEADSPHHLVILHKMFQHLRARAERGGAYGLLRPPTWPAEAGPQGRHICHPAGRAPDQ